MGGGGRFVEGGPPPFSFAVVAVFEVFTLNVSSAVVCAGELITILVHTPADASFASLRWFTLRARKQVDY